MVSAKAINLSVRPTRSADLCYPINGIIEYQPESLLGRSVSAYDLVGLKKRLEPQVELPSQLPLVIDDAPVGPADGLSGFKLPSVGDGPAEIESDLGRMILSRLRAADLATELTQALAWYALKSSADLGGEAVTKRIELLGSSPADPNSITTLLGKLSSVLRDRYDKLQSKYAGEDVGAVAVPGYTSHTDANTSGGQTFHTDSNTSTTYTGQEFQAPYHDIKARYYRAEIALRQERLAAYRLIKLNTDANIGYAKAMTAADIRKLQLGYIDTFLVAPFDGVVTAVFRNLGEFVAAGQPVLRLENDEIVYLVGQIKCRGLIRVGDAVHVSTTLFGEPGATEIQVDGEVCAVRGHEPVDEQWNVMVRCKNGAAGARTLPLNYNFDFEKTHISIEN